MIPLIISALEDPGERELFTQVFLDYHRLMFFEASKYVGEQHAKEDIVQNALLKAIEHSDDLKRIDPAKIPYWLVAITRNESISYLRHEAVIAKHSAGSLEDQPDAFPEKAAADDLAALIDRKSAIGHIWSALSSAEQLLLSGRYVLGYTDAELSTVLGCRESSIRMMLTRARRRAAALLKEEGYPDE